jgi:purine-binding chemotaxis protein CheW
MTGQKQYCTLRVADLLLGIEVGEIQEIIRETTLTPVPMAHPAIKGLINLRGQIVTAIDLRRRAGLEPAVDGAESITMVLGTAEEPLALVVDGVGDVVEVDAEAFESPPDTLRGEARRMIEGAYKLERKLLLVLNLQVVLDLQRSPVETAE